MRKLYSLTLVGVLIVSNLGVGCKSTTETPVNTAPVVEPAPMSVTITINDGTTTKNYTVTVPVDSSIQKIMEQADTENGLHYSTKENAGLGKFVDAIGGVATDPNAGKYWSYSVNGVPTTTGLDETGVQAGDVITWDYK